MDTALSKTESDQILDISEDAFHTIAGSAALAGLCPLIPIPFVDDAIIDQVRQRMYRKVFAHNGLDIGDDDLRYLTTRIGNPFPSRHRRPWRSRKSVPHSLLYPAWQRTIFAP